MGLLMRVGLGLRGLLMTVGLGIIEQPCHVLECKLHSRNAPLRLLTPYQTARALETLTIPGYQV